MATETTTTQDSQRKEQPNRLFNDSMAGMVPSLCDRIAPYFDRIPHASEATRYRAQLDSVRAAGERKAVDMGALDTLAGVLQYLDRNNAGLNGEVHDFHYLLREYGALMNHCSSRQEKI